MLTAFCTINCATRELCLQHYGLGGQARSGDPLNPSQVLSQLSYTQKFQILLIIPPTNKNSPNFCLGSFSPCTSLFYLRQKDPLTSACLWDRLTVIYGNLICRKEIHDLNPFLLYSVYCLNIPLFIFYILIGGPGLSTDYGDTPSIRHSCLDMFTSKLQPPTSLW